ncbi:MAG: YbhN family protein [Actinomycetota bacterium]
MIKRVFYVLVLGIALYLLIPRLGGLQRNLAALRHAHLPLMALGVLVEAAALLAYVALYRTVLRAQGAYVSLLAAGQGVMAGFFISHLIPGGAAAGTVANVKTMQREGVGARRTGVGVLLTAIVSDIALAVLFLAGLVYSLAKSAVPAGYVATALIIIPLLAGLIGVVFLFAYRRELAGAVVNAVARALHRVIKRVNAAELARAACDIADEARAVLSGRSFRHAFVFALANWLLDATVLYLFFLAVGHHQHFGALLVAYAVANLLSVIPVTPGGLGVMEATLVAISVGFGSPRSIAFIAVLGYRLVNFWLPLPVGLVAYVRARALPAKEVPE